MIQQLLSTMFQLNKAKAAYIFLTGGIIIMMLFSSCTATETNQQSEKSFTQEELSIIAKTDRELDSLTNEQFPCKSETERIQITESKLEELESSGFVKEGSIRYDSSRKAFTFKYNVDGNVIGGITVIERNPNQK